MLALVKVILLLYDLILILIFDESFLLFPLSHNVMEQREVTSSATEVIIFNFSGSERDLGITRII